MKSIAQKEGIKHNNKKYTVNVSFTGGVTYEVWAQNKGSAKELAIEEFNHDYFTDLLFEKTCDVDADALEDKSR